MSVHVVGFLCKRQSFPTHMLFRPSIRRKKISEGVFLIAMYRSRKFWKLNFYKLYTKNKGGNKVEATKYTGKLIHYI